MIAPLASVTVHLDYRHIASPFLEHITNSILIKIYDKQ